MNIRHALIACVVLTAFGQLVGAGCGGQLDATGPDAGSTNGTGATDTTSASSTGGTRGGSSGAGQGSSGAGSGGVASSGGSSGFGTSSSGGGSVGGSGSSSSGSGSGSGASPSSDAASERDASSGVGLDDGSESGAPDSGADSVAAVEAGAIDAAGGFVDGGGANVSDGGCSSAAVSFGADVMPVFKAGCTLSMECHGQMNNVSEENLYLGLNEGSGGSADSQAVYRGLVGVASEEDPSMLLVTAGDLSDSYLWHKLNGDQNTLAAGCAKATTTCADCTPSAPCGTLMPYDGEPFATTDPDFLCTIESWIAHGAPNN